MGDIPTDSVLNARALLGIGVDISDPMRLERIRQRNDVMLRVMHPTEQAVHSLEPLTASRIWASKEAVAKTLGTGFWQQGVDWPEIRLDAHFAVSLHGAAAACAGDSTFELEVQTVDGYVVVTALRYGYRASQHPAHTL